MVFVADDLGAWLVAALADAGRRRLADWVLGSEQERALRQVATSAVQLTAEELRPGDSSQADELALVISQVFGQPVTAPPTGQATLLEDLQAQVAGQLAVLDDANLTGIGKSSAGLLGLRAEHIAQQLTGFLVREIIGRGARGGPLAPLADQLNHDATHLQGLRIEEKVDRLARTVEEAPALHSIMPGVSGELASQGGGVALGSVLSGYRAQARDFAPEVLLDRDREVAELALFCGGSDPYVVWQGVPWAGKTALAAWFTVHPPPGVDVASFFITSLLAGQSDSAAFTEAMVEQLAIYAAENVSRAASPGGWDRERRRLLDLAGQRAAARGERLVLVVDGLDEDQSTRPGSGLPSIASLLPMRPPESVRVIVTTRGHPELPDDVPEDHPLRHCIRRELEPSQFAAGLARRARQELLDQLHGDQLQIDIIGYLTAADGGLTTRDLASLTSQPQYLIGSQLGRTWRADDRYDALEEADRAYLFAHETLREVARSELGAEVTRYRTRIDSWADDYQARGWPSDSPRYLLRPYGRLLTAEGSADQLFRLATDCARQDRMLVDTGGDAAALAEVYTAQELLLAESEPDLARLFVLAFSRDRLTERNTRLPPVLPAVLAQLGYVSRAEELARSLVYSESRVQALGELAVVMMDADRTRALGLLKEAERIARGRADWSQARALRGLCGYMARAGEYDRAEQLARLPATDQYQAEALAEVALAVAAADPDRARLLADEVAHLASGVSDPLWTAPVERLLASVAARAGDADRGEQLALGIGRSWVQAAALRDVSAILAGSGQYDRAEQLAARITDATSRTGALAALVRAVAKSDPDRARTLANEAEQAASDPRDYTSRAEIAAAIAAVDPDRARRLADEAERLARSAVDPGPRFPLAELAAILVTADPDRARRLADKAEQLARDEAHGWPHTHLKELAEVLAGAGQYEMTEQVINVITAAGPRAEATNALAVALAGAGEQQRAEQLLETVSSNGPTGWTAEKYAVALAKAGELDHAEQLITTISDSRQRAAGMRRISGVLARDGQYDRAERLARKITRPWHRRTAMTVLAEQLTRAGQYDHAEHVARTLNDPATLAHMLGELSAALADSAPGRARSLAEEAEQLIRTIPASGPQAAALGHLGAALAMSDPARARRIADEAEHLLRVITSLEPRESALRALSRAAARCGNYGHAEELARSITDRARLAVALSDLAATLPESHAKQARSLLADAEQIASTITDSGSQATAILDIAKAVAEHDHAYLSQPIRVQACRILAQAVTLGSAWREILEVLAILQPAVLPAVARAVITRTRLLPKPRVIVQGLVLTGCAKVTTSTFVLMRRRLPRPGGGRGFLRVLASTIQH